MKKVIGYLRVSTQGQAEDGVSLDAQKARIEAWAVANEPTAEVLVFRDEGISGKKIKNRPGLVAALGAAKTGDALVVYSLSRLSRSLLDTLVISEELNRRGVDLVSITDKIDTTSAGGKLYFNIMGAFNQHYRDAISDATKTALQYKKSRGEKPGGSFMPYGYKAVGKKFVEVPKEQAIIDQVHGWRREGMSLGAIAKQLEAQGVRRKAGGRRWYAVVVRRLVKRTA